MRIASGGVAAAVRSACRACVLLLFQIVAAAAQDTPVIAPSGSRPLVDPDATYVFNHLPGSDLILEAQIAPRIIVADSFGDATRRLLAAARKPVWGWQVSTTPMVRLRLFNEVSNPVRTPSYMPKATVQVARFQNQSASAPSDEMEFSKGPIVMWLVDVIPFGHHSNGQNGCLFASQTRDSRGACVEASPPPPDARSINRADGSFSTNYIQARLLYGRLYLDAVGAPAADYATGWEWRAGGGLQVNPKGYLPGSIDGELSAVYAPTRIIADAEVARRDGWRCARAEGTVRLQYLHHGPSGVPPFVVSAEAACLPRHWGGSGVFVRFYRGQDYYNLGFAESITRLQLGFTLQQDTFLSFKIRSQ